VSRVVREPHRLRPTREAVAHLRALLRDSPQPAWATPALVGLGFAASLAETLGITLIAAYVYAALGQGAVGGDWLGTAMALLQTLLGSPARMALAILTLILARAGLSFLNRSMAAHVSEQISENTRNRVHEQYLSVTYGRMQRYE
jgi:subfamily B ATP-binding cassette protein MsbA